MGSIDELVRDLRNFERRREVVKQLRKELRTPLPAVKSAVAASAMAKLPARGGLNAWVASTKVTATFRTGARTAGVGLRGGRNSARKRSDLKRMDAGSLRHPSWGRRKKGNWHVQTVTPRFFTEPAGEAKQWRDAALRAVDHALDTLRRG